jgi:putative oxidoreductase
MMKILTATHPKLSDVSVLLLRLTIGVILFAVGSGKVFKWFGGFGLQLTIQYFAKEGISPFWAYVSTFTEMIGGLFLVIGLLTRPAAFAVTINMLVAFLYTLPKGFLMGMAAYPFSLMMVALVILLMGPMQYSIDWLMFAKYSSKVRL